MLVSTKFKRYAPVLLILVAIAIGWTTVSFAPQPKRKATLMSIPLVIASPVQSEGAEVLIRALGTVKPVQEVAIRPRVTGTVISFNKDLQPGGYVKKNAILLQIDPVDYTLEVRRKESAVARARADLALEMGQQTVARAELEQMQRNLPGLERRIRNKDSMALARREPHLAQAQANLASVQADLDAAKINLARTKVQAPFNALVTARSISLGSQANTSDVLATLVNTDTYWIEAAVPLDRLHVIHRKAQEALPVIIRLSSGDTRQGMVGQVTGTLEPTSRMGHVLITVDDPLALKKENENLVPLVLGDHVQVEIGLGKRENVVALPRAALKGSNTVWVADDGKLDIRIVDILWRDTDVVYVQKGLTEGELVITSALSAPIQGMKVRLPKMKTPIIDTTSAAPLEPLVPLVPLVSWALGDADPAVVPEVQAATPVANSLARPVANSLVTPSDADPVAVPEAQAATPVANSLATPLPTSTRSETDSFPPLVSSATSETDSSPPLVSSATLGRATQEHKEGLL